VNFPLSYPLSMSFKIVTFVPQFTIHDANGQLIAYVRQKLFKLKEAVTVFADEAQTRPLYTLKADRILDWSARYDIANAQTGRPIGAVKREGMKSLWKAHYDVLDGDRPVYAIRGESVWVNVLDGIFGEIPVIGMFSGYLFHPAYLVSQQNGTIVMRLVKQPAFFEGRFELDRKEHVPAEDEERILLSLVMMVLLERGRG
jgi:uncharacterized protein YxjI